MSEIIVAGGGNGGIVAAVKLARAGHHVTLFEAKENGHVGLAQTDAFDGDTFRYADIEPSPDFKRGSNVITFFPEDRNLQPLTIPALDEPSFIVDRRDLAKYMFSLAEEAGVEIRYSTTVKAPIILGNRVAGIVTDKGDFYGDMIIDACGVFSPLRSKLPDKFLINREIGKYDIVHAYRAYYSKNKNAPEPDTSYNLYLRNDGTTGFSWLITEEDRTDTLICRFYRPEEKEISHIIREMQAENPQMGTELIDDDIRAIIPVCQPLGVLVCDGYAAVGDSAFMTIPVKGSGITYSFKAGTILADCIINDENGFYDTEALWEYQNKFFKEIGFGACHLAIIKNILPYLTASQVNDIFSLGLVTTEEIATVMSDKAGAFFNKSGILSVKNKIKLVSDNDTIKDILSNLLMWIGKFIVIEASYPTKYDRKSAKKWNEKYNDFFNSIKKPD